MDTQRSTIIEPQNLRKSQTTGQTLQERIIYPDILRTIAAFAVIMTHFCAYGFCNYNVFSNDWQIVNAYECLIRWAVPIFVMVSGIFFLDPERELTISKLYRKNIIRLVVAILFWGLLYQIANVAKRIILENALPNLAISDALKEFVLGPTWYHLWFLYMIIGLYILTPLFRIFTKNAEDKHYRYLFVLFMFFGCTLPLLQKLILCADKSLSFYFSLKTFLGYPCYFILGYFFFKHDVSKRQRAVVYTIAAISAFLQFIGTSLISYKYELGNTIFYDNFSPNVFFQTIAVFLFVKEIGTKIKLSNMAVRLIGILGKYSFGIYLVHDFFNGIFYRIGFSTMDIPVIFSIPLRTILAFVLSSLIVCMLAKIPIIKKYCI